MSPLVKVSLAGVTSLPVPLSALLREVAMTFFLVREAVTLSTAVGAMIYSMVELKTMF
jgi:hypothetical protein